MFNACLPVLVLCYVSYTVRDSCVLREFDCDEAVFCCVMAMFRLLLIPLFGELLSPLSLNILVALSVTGLCIIMLQVLQL